MKYVNISRRRVSLAYEHGDKKSRKKHKSFLPGTTVFFMESHELFLESSKNNKTSCNLYYSTSSNTKDKKRDANFTQHSVDSVISHILKRD